MSGSSKYAESVDMVMLFIVGASVLLLAGVTIAMIVFVIKYNNKRHPKAEQIEGHKLLEILWIAIPTALVMVMFYFGYAVYLPSRTIPDDAMIVKVNASMWVWKFEYDNGKQTDTLYLPIDKNVKLEFSSSDVTHSFFLPEFRLKEDVVPGRETYMVIKPDMLGRFDVACAEYCGLNHSLMYSKLVVMKEDEFAEWLNSEAKTPQELTLLKKNGNSINQDSVMNNN